MIFLLFAIYLSICHTIFARGLWPQPKHVKSGNSVLWLSPDILFLGPNGIEVSSLRRGISSSGDIPNVQQPFQLGQEEHVEHLTEHSLLEQAIRRTRRTILTTKFVPWKFHSRGSDFEPTIQGERSTIETVIILQENEPSLGKVSASAFLNGDETYNISISINGSTSIYSRSSLGTLRGLQTLEQLFYRHSRNSNSYTPYAPLFITDSPEWSHRGLNLDIARNEYRPRDVKRTIRAMASCKMSRLHIHATDAQSWPIHIPALPDLALKGAYRPHLIWSPEDVRDVQLYGLKRGISVFLEIDMPGHTGAIALSQPELIAAFNETDWSTFAAQPPSGSMKLNSPKVYDFLATLFTDLLPRLAPYTTFFHVGGDEVKENAYLLDDTVKENASEVLQPLVQRLMSNVTATVRAAGLTPIVWEEMLLDWNATFEFSGQDAASGPPVIVQVWRDASNLQKVLEQGYGALFGDYKHWYLDCGFGEFLNPYPSGHSPKGVPYNTSGGVPSRVADPFLDYCDPNKNWRHVYVYNPYVNISQDVRHLIHGGEVHMWSELTDPINLDSKLWPRAAAAAEVLWSGPRNANMIENASVRLGRWRERAVSDHRVGVSAVQITWCLMEGGCQW